MWLILARFAFLRSAPTTYMGILHAADDNPQLALLTVSPVLQPLTWHELHDGVHEGVVELFRAAKQHRHGTRVFRPRNRTKRHVLWRGVGLASSALVLEPHYAILSFFCDGDDVAGIH